MTTMATARQFWSVRYYVCEGDKPKWRIPNSTHRGLITGKLTLPQFEGQKVKFLEVFVGGTRTSPMIHEAKGSLYSFDVDGRLDTQPAVEAIVSVIAGSKPRRLQPNVVDIAPVVRHRRWIAENMWLPTQLLLRAVAEDVRGSSSGAKIRILKV